MDGRGSWRDNVFVERLWRTIKYEEVYLRAHDSVGDASPLRTAFSHALQSASPSRRLSTCGASAQDRPSHPGLDRYNAPKTRRRNCRAPTTMSMLRTANQTTEKIAELLTQ